MAVTYLQKGKSIGAHKGFAATWNWIVSWISRHTYGKGLSYSEPMSGAPRLDVELIPGPGIDVFCGGDGQPWCIGIDSVYLGGGKVAWLWDETNKTFLNPYVQINRTVTAVYSPISLGDGAYYVHISHPSGSTPTAALVAGPASTANDDENTYFWVATISGGKQTAGIYSMPVFYPVQTSSVSTPWMWDEEDRTFRNQYVQIGRTITGASVSYQLADGAYYVQVIHDMRAAVLIPSAQVADNDDNHTYFWVATISDGKQIAGIYSMPFVPLYE